MKVFITIAKTTVKHQFICGNFADKNLFLAF